VAVAEVLQVHQLVVLAAKVAADLEVQTVHHRQDRQEQLTPAEAEVDLILDPVQFWVPQVAQV
jgi:hypothetical protein